MLDELVGKQMRRWEIDRRMRKRFEQDEIECGMETPVITISRQWGSGGTNISKLVAKRLDFKLYDKEIIDHVAELSGARAEQVELDVERHPHIVSQLVLQLLEGKRPTASGYLRALVQVVREIAERGNAVIIGRASNFILPTSFRVRIVAPEAIRIARLAELHQVDENAARHMVVDSDRQRHRFVRSHFGPDVSDPLGYDLVINTEHYSIEHAADLIVKGFTDRREALEASCETPT